MTGEIIAPCDPRRLRQDLMETWQGRVLAATLGTSFGLVVQSVIGEVFDAEALQTLMYCVDEEFPGYFVNTTMLASRAKVDHWGRVVADVVWRDDPVKWRDVTIFRDELHMRDMFRALADRLKLSDQDRREFFYCVRKWCPSDMRIDPTMDPLDPDAKRLRAN